MFNPYINIQESNYRKLQVEEKDKRIFSALQDLWNMCQQDNAVPTQIIFGKDVWRKALKDPIFMRYFKEQDNMALRQSSGLVGYLAEAQVLTDYYKGEFDSFGWSIDPQTILFTIGMPLVGDL